MKNLIIVKHPLIEHKLSRLRDEKTNAKMFREYISEIASLITYETTRNLEIKKVEIKTPIAKTSSYQLKNEILLVPILRAGLGMVEGVSNLIPTAKIGHIGLYREEKTLDVVTYYEKLPKNIEDYEVFILDPMLATGNSAVKAIDIIKSKGCKKIKYIGIVGCDAGINNIYKNHPDVFIYLAAKDERLNEDGYIVPGLGDAGDRLFGTK